VGDVDEAVAMIRRAAEVPVAQRAAAARALAEKELSIETCAMRYRDLFARMEWESRREGLAAPSLPSGRRALATAWPLAAARRLRLALTPTPGRQRVV
jgi:hypothetical protein